MAGAYILVGIGFPSVGCRAIGVKPDPEPSYKNHTTYVAA